MLDQMKKLMEMKKQAEQIKRDLEATHVEVADNPGVKIIINGAQKFKSIELDFDVLNRDNKENLEQAFLKSANSAIAKSQAVAAQKMKSMAGLNIPGF